jgi:hypothetical protein
VFRLQAVDGDNDIEPREVGPVLRDDAEGAGDDLDVDAAPVQLGEKKFQLAIANERVSADERKVERTISVDDFEDALNQSVSLEIG